MNKFTPGPWRAEMVGDTNYARIFLHNRRDDGDSLRGYCGKANAHLIAAAPELYEALERLIEASRNSSEIEWLGEEQPWNAARAALAKARGEA